MELDAPVHDDCNADLLRVTHHIGNTGPWFGGGFYGKHRALAHNAEYVQGLGFCSFRHDDCGFRMGSLPPGPCLSGRPQTCCYLCESRQMEQAICSGIWSDVVHRIFLRLRTGSYFKLAMCHSVGNLCCRIRAHRVFANGRKRTSGFMDFGVSERPLCPR